MTVMVIYSPEQVVPTAIRFVETQDNWLEGQEVLYVSLMNFLSGTGYQVGPIMDYPQEFQALMLILSDMLRIMRRPPGSIGYDTAHYLVTNAVPFILIGM